MAPNNDQLFGQLSEINNYEYDNFCLIVRLLSGHATTPAYLHYLTTFKFDATVHPVQKQTLFYR
jgi:hypothetical protein